MIASLALFALAAIVIGRALGHMRFADLAAAITQTHGAALLEALLFDRPLLYRADRL